MQKIFILLITINLCIALKSQGVLAKDFQDTSAHYLAVLHTQFLNPEEAILNQSLEPDNSTVLEFQWIMDTLKNRCTNSEAEIVKTIIKAWKLIRRRGSDMTLLETARALSVNARNINLFGAGRVDFKNTTNYWISLHLANQKKSTAHH